MIDSVYNPHSADVRLTLRVNGVEYPLAKVGPDRVYLRQVSNLPAGPAEIVTTVDGRISRRTVQLPVGASGTDPSVQIR